MKVLNPLCVYYSSAWTRYYKTEARINLARIAWSTSLCNTPLISVTTFFIPSCSSLLRNPKRGCSFPGLKRARFARDCFSNSLNHLRSFLNFLPLPTNLQFPLDISKLHQLSTSTTSKLVWSCTVSSVADSIMAMHSNSSPSQQGRFYLVALDSLPAPPPFVSGSHLRGHIESMYACWAR